MAATAHRTPVRRAPAPRRPRRVSGPARTPQGRAQEAARRAASRQQMTVHAGAVALPRPVGAPAFAPRLLDALRRLPDSRWLDRLLRGQTWIALIGVALMGIVAMQVSLLKMNAGIGRAVEHAGTLERQNADLRATVSTLSSEERIQREAAAMGLVMPPAGDVRYLKARGAAEDGPKAASTMRAPNATQENLTQAQAGAAGAAAAGTTAPASGVTPAIATTPAAPAEGTPTPAQQQPAAQQAPPPTATAQPQVAAQPQAGATGAVVAPGATG